MTASSVASIQVPADAITHIRASRPPAPSQSNTGDSNSFVFGVESPGGFAPLPSIVSRLRQRQIVQAAARTVLTLVWDSALAGLIGWLVTYLFTFGNVVSGQSAQDQSYAVFCAGIMGLCCVLAGISNAAVHASSMLRLHFIDQPDRLPTMGKCMRRLLRRTRLAFVLSVASTSALAYWAATLPSNTHQYKLHFYISGVVMYVLSAVMDLAHRRIYQQETIDGQGYGTITQMSTFQGSLRLMKRNWFVCATVYGAAIYIQIAGELKLQTNQSLLLFTEASLGLKLLLQEAAKLVTVKGKRMQIKAIYIAVAIPTVLIDTQIRVALLRQSSVQNSITGSVVFSMVEIATRFVKVWLVDSKCG